MGPTMFREQLRTIFGLKLARAEVAGLVSVFHLHRDGMIDAKEFASRCRAQFELIRSLASSGLVLGTKINTKFHLKNSHPSVSWSVVFSPVLNPTACPTIDRAFRLLRTRVGTYMRQGCFRSSSLEEPPREQRSLLGA